MTDQITWRCRGCQKMVTDVCWLIQWPICLECANAFEPFKIAHPEIYDGIKLLFSFLESRLPAN